MMRLVESAVQGWHIERHAGRKHRYLQPQTVTHCGRIFGVAAYMDVPDGSHRVGMCGTCIERWTDRSETSAGTP